MRYAGGKGKSFQKIINLMPPHSTFIETHLGGGAVLRMKKPTDRNIGIDIDERVIDTWRSLYPDVCELVHGDAIKFLRNFVFSGNELLYVDPPYMPSTRRRSKVYRYDYSPEDHAALLDVLIDLPCKIIISGYDNKLYSEVLQNWEKFIFQSKTHAGVAIETIWINFKPPEILHDASYIGETFRERQTIQRRTQRMREKIANLSSIERGELIRWINSTYEI